MTKFQCRELAKKFFLVCRVYHLPPDEVEDGFTQLISVSPTLDLLFSDYVLETYVVLLNF